MLHVHSYNMGLAAGLAWKAMGGEHFFLGKVTAESKEGKFMLEILERTENVHMFFPSSFGEGFFNAFAEIEYKFINPING